MGTHPIFESDFDCLTELMLYSCRSFRISPRSHLLKRYISNSAPPTQDTKAVSRWLYICAGGACMTVLLGGATRLTESGLSMTSWDLIKDITRPQTEEDWIREFERYKTYPEYEEVHADMTLTGFKFIYHMERGHRNAGRTVGGVFMLPLLYFIARKRLSPRTMKRCLGIGCLLGFQGGLGWYMVKSGLEKNEKLMGQVRVSPYRLCAHLITAFTFISATLWTAMDISLKNRGQHYFPDHKLIKILQKKPLAIWAFTMFTVMSGAFVAGNDAGLIYNTYPLMADRWFPSDYWHPYLDETWRNFFENHANVQFNHRALAHLLILGVVAFPFLVRKAGITGLARTSADLCALLAVGQGTLGVLTLLNHVPVSLGTAHQGGAVCLMMGTLMFAHQMRRGVVNPKLARSVLSKSK